MTENILLTGRPGVGKTTVFEKTVGKLEEEGITVGGVTSPEIREDGSRVGFEIRDLESGESRILAHKDREGETEFGSYSVFRKNVAEISETAFPIAIEEADVIAIDEIAPMEIISDIFVDYVLESLDSDKPVLGVVHLKTETGIIGEIKKRPDTKVKEVTVENRERLPSEVHRVFEM
ncbi:MAG: NTPase [Halobacteria archaeon]